MNFDRGWRFARFGRMPEGEWCAEPPGLHACDFPDTDWRLLDVPHDWGIEGPFRADLPGETGKLPWKGIGWYRKQFAIPADWRDRRVFIDFDGAMAHARVWLNGTDIGGWPYGYNSFRLELTPHLKFGADNILAVRLDTEQWDSRWYPGAGIYRHVRLVATAPIHVAHWGVVVKTEGLSAETGPVQVEVTVMNQSDSDTEATAQSEIYELDQSNTLGDKIAESTAIPLCVAAGKQAQTELNTVVPRPKLWDIVEPRRYLARTLICIAGEMVDVEDTPFGFRTLEFTPRKGFRLNGRRVPLQGVCNHHDLGALGAAVNERALRRQLEILREMGCNAIRTAHNPPAPELLDLADRMGFLVQVEAFDCWAKGKGENDYSRLFADWHEKDLRAMVRRDRNHPCVFMWSIGNEVLEQDDPGLAVRLAEIVRSEDETRPVTCGSSSGASLFNGFEHSVDVVGINYNIDRYGSFLACHDHQDIPLYASETVSALSSRGEYFVPVIPGQAGQSCFQVSSYDIDAGPWGCLPDKQFAVLDRFPAVLGEFIWAGFDYLGEPFPYISDPTVLLNFPDTAQREAMRRQLAEQGADNPPSRSSYFGVVDLAGFPKDRYYAYQARWRPEMPMAHLFPHWNWPERLGQVTPVHLYTSGDEAELFLNGRSLGRKRKGYLQPRTLHDTTHPRYILDYRIYWDDVVYEPGELRAVVYRNGKEWAETLVCTSGEPTQLILEPDRPEIVADGRDLCFVTVRVADAEGRTVPRAKSVIRFEVEGGGKIIALDNGDPTSHEPFQSCCHPAFNGLCLAIVAHQPGIQAGPVRLLAFSQGLKTGVTTII